MKSSYKNVGMFQIYQFCYKLIQKMNQKRQQEKDSDFVNKKQKGQGQHNNDHATVVNQGKQQKEKISSSDKKSSKKVQRQRSRQKQKQKYGKDARESEQQDSPCQNQQEHSQEKKQFPDDDQLQRIMGFSSFTSSKHKDHTASACQGVLKNSQIKRQYRQYMNRRGGFNRKLDKTE